MTVPVSAPVSVPVSVERFALGTVPLGNYRRAIDDDDAVAVVDRAWDLGVRSFDTAPLYGSGLAEERLGRALAGRPRSAFRLSTKVGNLLTPDAPPRADLMDAGRPIYVDIPALTPVVDFSRDSVLRSVEGSLQRLGVDYLDTVYLHDPLVGTPGVADEAYPTLVELRSQGVLGAIGVGGSDIPAFLQLAAQIELDSVLQASLLTLLDHSADGELLATCREKSIDVVAGSVFNSGILAAPTARGASFDYRTADATMVARVEALRAVCARFEVDPIAAAMAFPLRLDGVGSIVVGAGTVAELEADLRALSTPPPQDFWLALTEWSALA